MGSLSRLAGLNSPVVFKAPPLALAHAVKTSTTSAVAGPPLSSKGATDGSWVFDGKKLVRSYSSEISSSYTNSHGDTVTISSLAKQYTTLADGYQSDRGFNQTVVATDNQVDVYTLGASASSQSHYSTASATSKHLRVGLSVEGVGPGKPSFKVALLSSTYLSTGVIGLQIGDKVMNVLSANASGKLVIAVDKDGNIIDPTKLEDGEAVYYVNVEIAADNSGLFLSGDGGVANASASNAYARVSAATQVLPGAGGPVAVDVAEQDVFNQKLVDGIMPKPTNVSILPDFAEIDKKRQLELAQQLIKTITV